MKYLPRVDFLYNCICRDNDFDIAALSETHLNETIDCSELAMADRFKLLRKDRNRAGGGVALYVKKELSPVKLIESNVVDIESLFVRVIVRNNMYILGVCYRPPGQLAD